MKKMKELMEKFNDWREDFTIDHPIIAGGIGGSFIRIAIGMIYYGIICLIIKLLGKES